MRRHPLSHVSAALFALLAACGGSSTGGPPPDVPSDVPSDGGADTHAPVEGGEAACAALAAAICAPIDACCANAAPDATTAACRAEVRDACVANGSAELAAVAAGEARVAQDALAACVGAYADGASACRPASADANARHCAGIFTDTAAIGEACASGLGGLRCAGGEGLCFPEPTGTGCKRFATLGQPCAEAPCPPWLVCMPGDGDALVCDAPRDIGGRCDADVHCLPEHRCEGGVCAAGLAAGAPCTRWFDCGAGLTCDPFEERCGPGADAGDACVTATQCAEGLVCLGLTVGMVCVPGEPSDGSDAEGLPGFLERCDGACQQGLTCAEGPVAGTCAPSACAATGP